MEIYNFCLKNILLTFSDSHLYHINVKTRLFLLFLKDCSNIDQNSFKT
jgi:hypothetical protein